MFLIYIYNYKYSIKFSTWIKWLMPRFLSVMQKVLKEK